MDVSLKNQLRAVIGFALPVSTDIAGQVQVGSAATLFARVEPLYREVPQAGPVDERTTHMIIMDENLGITEDQCRVAMFWLPGYSLATSSGSRRGKVTRFCYGEFGELDHVEVEL